MNLKKLVSIFALGFTIMALGEDNLYQEDILKHVLSSKLVEGLPFVLREGNKKPGVSAQLDFKSVGNDHYDYCQLRFMKENGEIVEKDLRKLTVKTLNIYSGILGLAGYHRSWGLSLDKDLTILVRSEDLEGNAYEVRNNLFKLAQMCRAQKHVLDEQKMSQENPQGTLICKSLPGTETGVGVRPPLLEAGVLSMINQLRMKNGMVPLTYDPILSHYAKKHGVYSSRLPFMRANHHFWSSRISNVKRAMAKKGFKVSNLTENSAYYMGQALPLEQIDGQLKASPGHRKNMLVPEHNSVGIGVVMKENKVFVAEIFATKKKEGEVSTDLPTATPAPKVKFEKDIASADDFKIIKSNQHSTGRKGSGIKKFGHKIKKAAHHTGQFFKKRFKGFKKFFYYTRQN